MDNGIVSLTFDDGLRCQFEQAIPILNQQGLVATFFLIANTGAFHERPEWRKINWNRADIHFFKNIILQKGHEIGSHSVTHRSAFIYSGDDAKSEAEFSKQWIESRLGSEVSSYCYPFYHVTAVAKAAVVKAGYKQARGGSQGSFVSSPQADLFDLDSRQVSPTDDPSGWSGANSWHVLTYHGIGPAGWAPIPRNEFARQIRQLAKLRDAGKVDILTFRDAAARWRLHVEATGTNLVRPNCGGHQRGTDSPR